MTSIIIIIIIIIIPIAIVIIIIPLRISTYPHNGSKTGEGSGCASLCKPVKNHCCAWSKHIQWTLSIDTLEANPGLSRVAAIPRCVVYWFEVGDVHTGIVSYVWATRIEAEVLLDYWCLMAWCSSFKLPRVFSQRLHSFWRTTSSNRELQKQVCFKMFWTSGFLNGRITGADRSSEPLWLSCLFRMRDLCGDGFVVRILKPENRWLQVSIASTVGGCIVDWDGLMVDPEDFEWFRVWNCVELLFEDLKYAEHPGVAWCPRQEQSVEEFLKRTEVPRLWWEHRSRKGQVISLPKDLKKIQRH